MVCPATIELLGSGRIESKAVMVVRGCAVNLKPTKLLVVVLINEVIVSKVFG